MDSPEWIVIKWLAFAFTAALLVGCIWHVIVLRRAGRPLPPGISAQVLMILAVTSLAASHLVNGAAKPVLICVGALFGTVGSVRMWSHAKQHLRDVRLIKPTTTDDATGQNQSSPLNRAG